MTKQNIMVIGSGGREHTLAWALSRSPQVGQVYVAPGNGGTEWLADQWSAVPNTGGLHPQAGSKNVALAVNDLPGLVNFARDNQIDLTVVGPEAALAVGLVDAFQEAGLPIFGPTQQVAQLEASKAFAKDFMRRHNIPTGDYHVFDNYQSAQNYLKQVKHQVVVKADGLAAGKGVIVCDDLPQAQAALQKVMVEQAFGQAGEKVVIEERLTGPEISILAWSDGQTVIPIIPARDHKPAYDGDEGPNTGGMGAYAPAPDIRPDFIDTIQQTVLQPVINGMAAQGLPYKGILYAGLMLTPAGPKVLEFNCRFGDPETQVVLPLLETDIVDIFQACIAGQLHQLEIRWKSKACATVVMASPGYPGNYPKGLRLEGLENAAENKNIIVFHAGTTRSKSGWLTAGGRVLAVTAIGDDLTIALSRAYAGVEQIHFKNAHYRRDIGQLYQ